MIDDFTKGLEENNIRYHSEHGVIFITLPNDFGVLEYKMLNDERDDILMLLNQEWHTHSSVEGGTKRLVNIVKNIFSGEILLIEETDNKNETKRRIERDLEYYLRFLPKDYKYKVCNS